MGLPPQRSQFDGEGCLIRDSPTDAPRAVPLYILSGGRSSRFGRDKARALVEGRPLLLHVADALAPRVAGIAVVADADGRHADLGLRCIADRSPGRGPLAGLHAALLDVKDPGWLLLVACDWVGLNPSWVDLLLAAREPSSAAVAFRGWAAKAGLDGKRAMEGPIWEPLFALYHRRLLQEVTARLVTGRLALWRLLQEISVQAVTPPADWARARQINCPGDVDSAAQRTNGLGMAKTSPGPAGAA